MPFDGEALVGEIVEDEGPCVHVAIIYNTLEPNTRDLVELDWQEGRTLTQYMSGLPSEVSWSVYTSKGVIPVERWSETVLVPDERLVLMLTPNGGFGRILGMLALVALAIFAPYLGGLVAGAVGFGSAAVWGGVIMALGGLLISALMPKPPTPNNTTSSSYSLSGAKNTSAEGLPVPYGYGEFRVAGNRVNLYVENDASATTQIVYAQYVISDGEIDSISDVEVNQRPLDEFKSVLYDERLGLIDQMPMSWFAQSIAPFHVGSRIDDTQGVRYTTSQPIDRFRLDIGFPGGLYKTASDGTMAAMKQGVPLIGQYRLKGTEAWQSLNNISGWIPVEPGTLIPVTTKLRVTVEFNGDALGPTTTYNSTINAVDVGTTRPPHNVALSTWLLQKLAGGGTFTRPNGTTYVVTAGAVTQVATDSGVISNTKFYDVITGDSYVPGAIIKTFEVTLASGQYGLVVSGTGGVVIGVEAVLANQLQFDTDKKTHPRHFSVHSPALERGVYEIWLKRQFPESTKTTTSDKCDLDDVNEIQTDPVAYNGTAYYAVAIGLTDQISGEPNITVKAKMRKVNIYDKNGNITDFRWSNNCADVVLDILLAWRSRYAIPASRIDFFAFDRWRTFCTANSLTFNGVFDAESSVWDAVQTVMICGRANIIMSGVRWTVLIDEPREAVMMFTADNMIQGTFQSHWSGLDQRANHIEWQYYDETDRNKQKSVFAINNDALDRGEAVRKASVRGMGFTNANHAQRAAQLQLNRNRYILQGVSFEAPIEAMGCGLGDVVYVQNDMPQWGYSAMITAVADQTHFTIDTQVPFDGQDDWRILFVRGAVQIDAKPIAYVSGREVRFTGFAAVSGAHRLVVVGDDYEIMDEVIVSGDLVMTLDRIFNTTGGLGVGTEALFYRTDVMVEARLAAAPALQLEGQPLIGASTISITYGNPIPLETEVPLGLETEGDDDILLDQAPIFAYGHSEFEIWGEDDTRLLAEEISISDHVDLTITGWINNTLTPEPGDRVMIGKVGKFKKPFQINKIGYKDDHTRSLDMLEYNPTIYEGAAAAPTPSYSSYPDRPEQVILLRAGQTFSQLQGGAMLYAATVSWDRPLNDQRGYTGAKIYVSKNYEDFIFAQMLTDTTNYEMPAQAGDTIRFRVVAFDRVGVSANYDTAPTVGVVIIAGNSIPTAPDNVSLTPGVQNIALNWVLPTDDYIAATEVWQGVGAELSGASRVWVGKGTHWLGAGISTTQTEFFWLRTISITGVPSAWVGPFEDAATTVQAVDIQPASIGAAHLDDLLTGIEFVDVLPDTDNYSGRIVFVDPEDSAFIYRRGQWEPFIHAVHASEIQGQILSEQIQGLAAAKLQGQITPSQIAPSAITPTKIADGAVGSNHVAAGTINRNHFAVGVATNECWNSCLELTSAGWVFEATCLLAFTGKTKDSSFDPVWRLPGYGSGMMAAAEALTLSGIMDANWDPNSADGLVGIPWREGRVIEVQAAVLPMSCAAMVGVRFIDATGHIISTISGTRIAYPGLPPDGKAISNYQRTWLSALAPTGTVRARPYVRAVNDGGADIYATGGNPMLFYTQFSAGQGVPFSAEPQPWQPGSGPSLSGQVIKPGTIDATQIAIGALSNLQTASAVSQAVLATSAFNVLTFELTLPAGAAVLLIWSGTTDNVALTLGVQRDGVPLAGSPAIDAPGAGTFVYTLTATNAGGSTHNVTTCQLTILALNR